MMRSSHTELSRRTFLGMLLALPAAWVLVACGRKNDGQLSSIAIRPVQPESSATPGLATTVQPTVADAVQVQLLAPTPACGDDDDDDLTPAQTEGPFYTPNTPQRSSFLEPGITGTKMVVTGYVLSTTCEPVAGALLDFWHCDGAGVYDNVGFKLRGHQFADSAGRFVLETIMPGLYPGRTRHFHVKVQAPNRPVLTTQLYFPGEPDNARDGIYNPALEMAIQDTADARVGTFNFVLNV